MTDLISSLKTLASSPTLRGSHSRDLGNSRATGPPSLHLPIMRDSCMESGFAQWRDAMRMVARLPGGLPNEFRLRLWENLADRWLSQNDITWDKIQRRVAQPNSRDQEIGEQIVKDLHRTGCVGFSGQKQAILKEVLLAFARWNGDVGYCQGLNMIGATLLQMTSGDSKLTLKILIFVIDGVLPEGYFSQGLRGLAVDMAVFRNILKNRKPTLHAHLSRLQKRDDSPPLTDVFTMHWFLTLFIHCLPNSSVLRIWDLLLLEGSEVLLRAALVLWAAIETRVLSVQTTDEFYSVMGVVTREMIEFGLLEPNALVKCIVSLGSFPYPGLKELRERHRNPENLAKSFFLPKKELDALKRHYAAIRHRQRNTTIILKSLEAPLKPKPKVVQRSLPTHQLKRGTGHSPKPKPKLRRMSSNSKVTNSNNTTTSHNANNQVTLTWDKTQKKPKKVRKRRPSASSMTTSSSSTELCDTDDESDKDSDAPDGLLPAAPASRPPCQKIISKPPDIIITPTPTRSLSFEETEAELILLTENSTQQNGGGGSAKPLDASDSQYFLDELSRIDQLRKSYGMTTEGESDDNFYENLSQRICQLQFQNLTLLTHFTNERSGSERSDDLTSESDVMMSQKMDVMLSQKLDILMSPLPSPISPILSFHEHFSGHHFPSLPTSRSTDSLSTSANNMSRAQTPSEFGNNSESFGNYSEPFGLSSTISDSGTGNEELSNAEEGENPVEQEEGQDGGGRPVSISQMIETRDEITNIIRENLEILQRLKLKEIENEENISGGSSAGDSSSGDDAAFKSKSFHRSRAPNFNPFPTSRKPRTKTTKFGLYK